MELFRAVVKNGTLYEIFNRLSVKKMWNRLGADVPNRILVLVGVDRVTCADGSVWTSSASKLSSISTPDPSSPHCTSGQAALKPASFVLPVDFNPIVAPAAYYQARCGLCWNNGGTFKCLVQPNFVCNFISPTNCKSQQSTCDPV
jgi:hypothetical protein